MVIDVLDSELLAKRALLPVKPAPVKLIGKTVYLQPLDIDRDGQALFEMSNGSPIHLNGKVMNTYDQDTLIWRYMFDGPFINSSDFKASLVPYVNSPNGLYFTVFDITSNRQIGVANFMNNFPQHLKIELGGIWYSPIVQRTKCNTEATYLMLKHAFDLGYRRVEWKCDALNVRSRQAALRMGFKFEGIQESHFIVKDCNRDTAWFRILDSEWPTVKSKLDHLLS